MARRVLLIGGRTTDESESVVMKEYAAYFVEGIEDVQAYFVHFDELSFVIAPDVFTVRDHRNGLSINEYDLVIFRGKIRANSELAYCVSRYCEYHNVKFFNDYTSYRPASKVAQAVTFFELKVPFMKTLYAMNPDVLRQIVEAEITKPFILKDSYGSHGNDNYLLQETNELISIVTEHPDKRFIVQEFFPNDCDYRVLCVGPESLVIRRTAASKDSHLNNTSQGGAAEIVPESFFPAKAMEQAHAIASKLDMSIAGVDLLYNDKTKDYAFLEVNSQPQLNSGAFPNEKQHIVGRYIASLL